MKRTHWIAALALGGGLAGLAQAYPEGAPWGAADPLGDEHCASCHWDGDARRRSSALRLEGLPRQIQPERDYALTLVLADASASIAGFQIIASADGQTAGELSGNTEDVEAAPLMVALRSTAPRNMVDGEARWPIVWRTPSRVPAIIVLHLAATGANDDGSPLGDQVHYRHYDLVARPADEKKRPPAPEDRAAASSPKRTGRSVISRR